MNIKEIIRWSLKRWWWFVISIFCCLVLAGVYFFKKAPVFNVEAVLMLRQSSKDSRNQSEMLQMMGLDGQKITGDEVKILSSRDLMARVADTLDLYTTYWAPGERYDVIQFPKHDFTVTLCEDQLQIVTVKLIVRKSDYKVIVKKQFSRHSYSVKSLDAPLHTFVGDIIIDVNNGIKPGTYTAQIMPRIAAVNVLSKQIMVKRLAKESNVITLSTASSCPARSIATINMLLDLYNQETATDKNRLAIQSEQFLSQRLALVEVNLNRIESQLEAYKRNQQIGDLGSMAINYQQTGEAYEHQVAELTEEINMLDLLEKQLSDPKSRYSMIPGNVGVSDGTLNALLQDYNTQVAYRINLLQTATEENPLVVQISASIDQKRVTVLSGLAQSRNTLTLRRQFIQNQQREYDTRLASIPETERRYLELQREKQAVEKQYVYLIEKREENAMLLASEMLPSKVVDRAQLDPNMVSPNMTILLFLALVIGVCIPLSVYFWEVIRKEYL